MIVTTTEYVEIPGLEGVSVVRHAGGPPTGARHAHRSVSVGAILTGTRHIEVRSVRHAAPAGTVLVIPPDVVHACDDRDPVDYIMISISGDRFVRAGLLPPAGETPLVVDDPERFQAVLRLADAAGQSASRLERQDALTAVMVPLGAGGVVEAEDGAPDRILAVRRHLEERAEEDVPLEVLARLAGCSPWRLNRVFSRAVGMPPHEYQAMQRVRRVTASIRNGNNLAESAAEAGFFDQSHMTRCFRKFMGMTPGVFAAGVRPRGEGDQKKPGR